MHLLDNASHDNNEKNDRALQEDGYCVNTSLKKQTKAFLWAC